MKKINHVKFKDEIMYIFGPLYIIDYHVFFILRYKDYRSQILHSVKKKNINNFLDKYILFS